MVLPISESSVHSQDGSPSPTKIRQSSGSISTAMSKPLSSSSLANQESRNRSFSMLMENNKKIHAVELSPLMKKRHTFTTDSSKTTLKFMDGPASPPKRKYCLSDISYPSGSNNTLDTNAKNLLKQKNSYPTSRQRQHVTKINFGFHSIGNYIDALSTQAHSGTNPISYNSSPTKHPNQVYHAPYPFFPYSVPKNNTDNSNSNNAPFTSSNSAIGGTPTATHINSAHNSILNSGNDHGTNMNKNSTIVSPTSSSTVIAPRTNAAGITLTNRRGKIVLSRSQELRQAHPDRVNLNHLQLTQCPILENNESGRIQFLSLQSNFVTDVAHLEHLKNLIFLDLYNNHLEFLGSAFGYLTSLRVLLLGKNRIFRIQNLEHLRRLDVLDLHSNFLTGVENLNTLQSLRVLNLAGNKIRCLDDMAADGGEGEGEGTLKNLVELNLRRNCLECVPQAISEMSGLQRVFLSNNRLRNFNAIAPLTKIKNITELSLVGNALARMTPPSFHLADEYDKVAVDGGATDNAAGASSFKGSSSSSPSSSLSHIYYRAHVINLFKSLRHLDLRKVHPEERQNVETFIQQYKKARRIKEEGNDNWRQVMKEAESMWVGDGTNGQSSNQPNNEDGCDKAADASKGGTSDSQIAKSIESVAAIDTNDARGENDEQLCDPKKEIIPSGGAGTVKTVRELNGQIRLQTGGGPREGYRIAFSSLHRSGNGKNNTKARGGMAKKGYYEIEVPLKRYDSQASSSSSCNHTNDNEITLNVYGDGWDFLDGSKMVNICNHLVVHFASLKSTCDRADQILRKMPKLAKITFLRNDIKTYQQCQRLTSFFKNEDSSLLINNTGTFSPFTRSHDIDILSHGNAVMNLALVREFMACCLPNLAIFNGVHVSEAEREKGRVLFTPLFPTLSTITSHHTSNVLQLSQDILCHICSSTAQQQRQRQQTNTNVTSRAISTTGFTPSSSSYASMVQIAASQFDICAVRALALEKASMQFEQVWPDVVNHVVALTLGQVRDIDEYMNTCLDDLMD